MTALMVGAWLAGQLAGPLHMALADHAICLEHGQAVDRHDATEPAGAHPRARLAETTRSAAREGTGVADAAHEHCPLAQHRDEQNLRIRPAAAMASNAALSTTLAPDTTEFGWSASELRLLAPKTSPPA